MAITLVLVDDHPFVMRGLQEFFDESEEFRVLDACANGPDGLEAIRRHRPDVAVVDIRLPGFDGLQLAHRVRDEGLPTKIVILTAELTDEHALEILRLGIRGVVLKHMAGRLLMECVRKVQAGEYWVEKESLRRAAENLVRADQAPKAALTQTEVRILRLAAESKRNKEIADALHVSEATVKTHLHNMYVKLGVSTRRDLVERARALRLL